MTTISSALQLTLADALTILLALVAIAVSLWTFASKRGFEAYTDVDGLYQEVLKMGIDHPDFRNGSATKDYKERFKDSPEELLKYETYAYIVWNFLETLYDHDLMDSTWAPAFHTEWRLHSAWFDVRENQSKFKDEFRSYVRNRLEADLNRFGVKGG